MIGYTCVVLHDDARALPLGPTITFVEGAWAYCARGGVKNHDWRRTPGEGLTVDEIRARGLVHERVFAKP